MSDKVLMRASGSDENEDAADGVGAPEQTREEPLADRRRVELFEGAGIAAAEASGNTGVEGQRKLEGEQPGSG